MYEVRRGLRITQLLKVTQRAELGVGTKNLSEDVRKVRQAVGVVGQPKLVRLLPISAACAHVRGLAYVCQRYDQHIFGGRIGRLKMWIYVPLPHMRIEMAYPSRIELVRPCVRKV